MRGGGVECVSQKILHVLVQFPVHDNKKTNALRGQNQEAVLEEKNSGRRVGTYRRELFSRRIKPAWRLEHADRRFFKNR